MQRASTFFLFISRLGLCVALVLLLPSSQAWASESGETKIPAFQAFLTGQISAQTAGASSIHHDIQTLYQLRQHKPAWITDDQEPKTTTPELVTFLLYAVESHGLDKKDYPADSLRALLHSTQKADALRLELEISTWIVRLARDMTGGRVNLSELYVGWSFKRPERNLIADLAKAIDEEQTIAFLESLSPTDPSYRKLAQSLETYRKIAAHGGWKTIPTGPTIKADMRDERVPLLIERLAAEGYLLETDVTQTDPALYGAALQNLVRTYQSRNGLEVDGNVGAQTLATLNLPAEKRIEQIMANMERLRHMPRVFPARYVLVNIAQAALEIIENNTVVYQAPVIVGRPDRKTPFIQSTIRSIIFNPSWHVPARIARDDILPKLRKDPHYLEKMGFVLNTTDGDDPDSATVDWSTISASAFAFRLRQAPGDTNSLGRIKFDFDNNFSVYMHGTPHEELFAKANRHLSSGCIRLKEPEQFAVFALDQNEGSWSEADVQAEIDKSKTKWMKIAAPLPLYVIYQTAFFPTDDSPVYFARDVYNYDTIVMNAINER